MSQGCFYLEHEEATIGSVVSCVDSAQVRHHKCGLVGDATQCAPLGDVCVALEVDRDLRGAAYMASQTSHT